MVEGVIQRETVKMIPKQVFVVPTEQVFAEKCQDRRSNIFSVNSVRLTEGC